MRQLEMRGSKGKLLGPWCTCMCKISTSSQRGNRMRPFVPSVCMLVFLSAVTWVLSSTSKREEQFLIFPGYRKVSFPIHQVHWVLGVRGSSAEANMWINKSKIPCLFWATIKPSQSTCKKNVTFSVSFLGFICKYCYICSAVIWITFCCLMFWFPL